MDDAADMGRQLARRHLRTTREPTELDRSRSLVHYAESSRGGDWSLRSALVRLAQREPVRAGAVLELIRRCDASLTPHVRTLDARMADRSIDAGGALLPDREPNGGADGVGAPADTVDSPLSDLARVARHRPDTFEAVLSGYREVTPLDDEEVGVIGLLTGAVVLDDLADALTGWAAAGATGPPPTGLVDRLSKEAYATLEAQGVPRDERPGPPSRRDRR